MRIDACMAAVLLLTHSILCPRRARRFISCFCTYRDVSACRSLASLARWLNEAGCSAGGSYTGAHTTQRAGLHSHRQPAWSTLISMRTYIGPLRRCTHGVM